MKVLGMLFCLILYVLAALIPAYVALRMRNYLLAGICAVAGICGVLLFVPYIIAVVLVSRKLPRDVQPPFSGKILAAFWGIYLAVFALLPVIKYNGTYINGIGIFTKLSWQSSIVTQCFFILVLAVIGLVVSFFLHNRAVFTGGSILLYCWTIPFAATMASNLYYQVAAFGTFLEMLLAFGGLALLFYNAHCISGAQTSTGAADNTAEGIELLKSMPGKIRKQASDFKNSESGQKLRSDLHTGIGKAAGAVKDAAAHVKSAPEAAPNPRPDATGQPSVGTVSGYVRTQDTAGLLVTCRTGEYAGAAFELRAGEQAILGTDPACCNLIFSAGEISRLHCAILCPQQSGLVTLSDYSTNGTYFADGTRIAPGSSAEYKLPCTISFGRRPETFEITEKRQ